MHPSTESPSAAASHPAGERRTRFRWVVLGLVFFATTVNYLDRMVMGILAPDLQKLYNISDQAYGNIQAAFAMSYAFGQLASGALLDSIGVKAGLAFALTGWSVASILHAFARGPWGFGIARGLLGVTESPNFPAATKTLSEWFPKNERAFAFGFVNAGTNMGAILAPAVVPWLATTYGWQWAFIGTGAVGLVFLLFWLPLYRPPAEHPRVSPAELAHIQSDPPEPVEKIPWATLFTYRQAWAFAIGKFLTDSMWWFFMTWFPKFLHTKHDLNLLKIGLPLVIIYLLADVGSVAGGWFSSFLIKRGISVNFARKAAMFLAALGVMPVMFAQDVSQLWLAVAIMGLATASHQAFSSNLYTLVSDMFPKRSVASVAGFGGTCGYFGAALFQPFVGHMVQEKQNYTVPFLCAGLAYIAAFAVIHWLAPRLKPAGELK